MRWVFWVSICLVAYAYVGYPLWLWLRSHWAPRPVLRGQEELSVTAVMVVRNEAAVLARKIENLLSLDYPQDRFDVVVVSDGSTDGTAAIIAEFEQRPRLRSLIKQEAEGKAAGLNDAMQLVTGQLVLFTDARQQIERGALRCLVENFADAEVGAASGELMLGDPATGETNMGTGAYWRIEKMVRQLESASGSVVGATGAIYCARRNLFRALPAATVLDDVLIPMQIVSGGARVILDSRARAWDSPDLGQEREFMRKVRTLSGNYQLLQLAPWLLSAKNPIRFEFVSHKLLRLAGPFALTVAFAVSIFLSGAVYRVALILQLLFYGLSLLALLHLSLGPLARIADASLTFVLLNAAAALAFMNFVTGRKPAWGGRPVGRLRTEENFDRG
jgi:poly-beta-1,6-N-acetyl-D-glucosamine synthase